MDTREATLFLTGALNRRSLTCAKLALLCGADVDAPINRDVPRPGWLVLLSKYGDQYKHCERVHAILELILIQSRKISHRSAWLRVPLHDRAASSIFLAAIMRTGGAKPDLGSFVKYLGDPGDPHHPARKREIKRVMRVHALVVERLKNPKTPFERKAFKSITDQNQDYWSKPLIAPDLTELPTPSKEYIDALVTYKLAKNLNEKKEILNYRDALVMTGLDVVFHRKLKKYEIN
jgi:hypothetical protein